MGVSAGRISFTLALNKAKLAWVMQSFVIYCLRAFQLYAEELTLAKQMRFSASFVSRKILLNAGKKTSHGPHHSWWQSKTVQKTRLFGPAH